MHPQDARIKSRMQVISSDGQRVGYVERLTDTEIITVLPCRHISLASIRDVSDGVHIVERYCDVQNLPLPPNRRLS